MKIVTLSIETLAEIAGNYDVIVLDQWGVLHDGTKPYTGVIESLQALASTGHRLAVLSNSGKRSSVNASRITQMGFNANLFERVMTSGEALWRDVNSNKIPHSVFFPIERNTGDASLWAEGLDISLTADPNNAQAILLMGLPDGSSLLEWQSLLQQALNNQLIIYCSNPDISSPRRGGKIVISPGILAHEYKKRGGKVVFYGKPYSPVFLAIQHAMETEPEGVLMVGDSLEHDIVGAHNVGWETLFVSGGINQSIFSVSDPIQVLTKMAREKNLPMPTYMIQSLK